ncbi:MAG: dUTP diphosphatase [Candidatus Kerfeldbacteria bacterium CG_4_10_14_0_8_um_filter_42_10]|uniref:dUTP diphosphatase n=1 Tax=Candidatus Kerfeldbacteria bacterium CG_4_10_14_0_8_um_filter_42_10 TaxID=2014248 RepID=A0A2M7RJG9_9BACT|nr:MAG: dUTP diphosphatase [Candidatus Kerfeldbacteria bacterium CG_4_10_14_0_8_um_filter_42_10]
MIIKIKQWYPELKIPSYAHPGDAGLDLYSREDKVLNPGERHLFKMGFSLELPKGYVAFIWDRSGLAAKNGITNLGGVIEHTYRGEYGVILLNIGKEEFAVKKGDRIAQLLIQKIETVELKEVTELSDSARGVGGFGSTGK